MNNNQIVQKLWNLCNVLRDDGITYHQYVTELTYILFLKMASELGDEDAIGIPEKYKWDKYLKLDGEELLERYKKGLSHLSGKLYDEEEDKEKKEKLKVSEKLKNIYKGAQTNIEEPANLEKLFKEIDKLDWFDEASRHDMGDLYEGLLEKNANEKKSGAGQYFTPRVLIDSMVRMTKPKIGERICDPAAGTWGFIMEADKYLKEKYDFDSLDFDARKTQKEEVYFGCELVSDTHRLAMMNALLHEIDAELMLGDALSEKGTQLKNFDLVLSNPPFGTKKGGERATRGDLTYETSNKQLNFLQVIYNSLKKTGEARAAVVLPDNVLFEGKIGAEIRKDLMNKCNLHTILRLPTGIFYAPGVKTNVLFFTRGTSETNNTKNIWYYDMRTNMPNFGKTNPLRDSHFAEFEKGYEDISARKGVERWNQITLEEIEKKEWSLDLGLIKDNSIVDHDDLPNPVDSANDAIDKLDEAMDLLRGVIKELKVAGIEGEE